MALPDAWPDDEEDEPAGSPLAVNGELEGSQMLGGGCPGAVFTGGQGAAGGAGAEYLIGGGSFACGCFG